jgi:hypothetical protein
MRLLSRGLYETAEILETAQGRRALVYSFGEVTELNGGVRRVLAIERAASSRSVHFPLATLARSAADPGLVATHRGLQDVAGRPAHCLHLQPSFATEPRLVEVADLGAIDVWLDVETLLPVKMTWRVRSARGAAPSIAAGRLFDDYRRVGSVLYPHRQTELYNGTARQVVTIEAVRSGLGLPHDAFLVGEETPP